MSELPPELAALEGYQSTLFLVAERIAATFDASPAVPTARTMEAAETVMALIYGHLRGRMPFPFPHDLLAVAISGGARILKSFAYTGTAFLDHGRISDVGDLRPWNGWMTHERMILARYRQRTA